MWEGKETFLTDSPLSLFFSTREKWKEIKEEEKKEGGGEERAKKCYNLSTKKRGAK